jgi:hypothetical protein
MRVVAEIVAPADSGIAETDAARATELTVAWIPLGIAGRRHAPKSIERAVLTNRIVAVPTSSHHALSIVAAAANIEDVAHLLTRSGQTGALAELVGTTVGVSRAARLANARGRADVAVAVVALVFVTRVAGLVGLA